MSVCLCNGVTHFAAGLLLSCGAICEQSVSIRRTANNRMGMTFIISTYKAIYIYVFISNYGKVAVFSDQIKITTHLTRVAFKQFATSFKRIPPHNCWENKPLCGRTSAAQLQHVIYCTEPGKNDYELLADGRAATQKRRRRDATARSPNVV